MQIRFAREKKLPIYLLPENRLKIDKSFFYIDQLRGYLNSHRCPHSKIRQGM